MGNKRKAVAIILGVVVFAVGIVSGALLAFKPRSIADTPVSSNAISAGGSESYYYPQTVSLISGRKYLVELSGGKGGGVTGKYQSNKGGKGMTTYGFLDATKTSYAVSFISGGSTSKYKDYTYTSGVGGSAAKFEMINFALPSGRSAQPGIASGGGGAGGGREASGHDEIGNDGGNGGYQYGGTPISVNGLGGTWTGASGNASGSQGGSGTGGGGGSGYYGGSNGQVAYFHSAGGGGSSSPNTYPQGYNNGSCFVRIIDITPTANPTLSASTVNPGATFTVNNGTANNPIMDMPVCAWQYSLDNSTWQTSNSLKAQGSAGTQKVYWRYVITERTINWTEPGGYKGQPGSITTVTRPLTVIASGSLDLTVALPQGTVSAPTLTGNGSATYSGNDIQVVTAAGQSSGTFTFATVKTKDEE